MKKLFAILVVCMTVFVISPAITHAADLTVSGAKASGLVGEKPDGLLGAVSADPAVAALVSTTNAARLSKYRGVADKNGLTLQQVQGVAGDKLIREAKKGHYIWRGGSWQKK